MQEVTRACLTCKDNDDVYLVPENRGVQRAFKRGPMNETFIFTDDECEVCGGCDALKKE